MAQFRYLQAAVAGFGRLFRREVFIRRDLILERMLFDLLPVDFGGLRPGRILPDAVFYCFIWHFVLSEIRASWLSFFPLAFLNVISPIRLAFSDDELRGTLALVCQSTLDGGKRLPHLADLPPLIPIFREQFAVLPRAFMATGIDLTHSVDSSVVGV